MSHGSNAGFGSAGTRRGDDVNHPEEPAAFNGFASSLPVKNPDELVMLYPTRRDTEGHFQWRFITWAVTPHGSRPILTSLASASVSRQYPV
jgi:hypothetical protein